MAIAYRPYNIESVPSSDEELENWQLPESELILLAIVGIKVLVMFSVLTAAGEFFSWRLSIIYNNFHMKLICLNFVCIFWIVICTFAS